MADENTVEGSGEEAPLDQQAGAAGAEDSQADGSGDGSGGTPAQDAKVLAKRLNDLQAQLSRTQSEKDKALSRAERLENDVLSKLAEARGPSADDQREQRRAQQEAIASLKKRYDDGEMNGEEFIELLEGVRRDAEAGAEAKVKPEIEELRKLATALGARVADYDPEYQRFKGQITELAEKTGMDPVKDRDILLRVARAVGPKVDNPPRAPIPASTRTPVVTPGGVEGAVTSETIAAISGLPGIGGALKPEEIAALKKKWSKS